MTTPVPTADLLHVAGLTRDHLRGQVAAHSEYRYVIQRGTDVMVAGVASAERITDLTLRRAYLIGALTGSGEMPFSAAQYPPPPGRIGRSNGVEARRCWSRCSILSADGPISPHWQPASHIF